MPTLEFTRLMNRFYEASSGVLFDHDAIVETFVGDEELVHTTDAPVHEATR